MNLVTFYIEGIASFKLNRRNSFGYFCKVWEPVKTHVNLVTFYIIVLAVIWSGIILNTINQSQDPCLAITWLSSGHTKKNPLVGESEWWTFYANSFVGLGFAKYIVFNWYAITFLLMLCCYASFSYCKFVVVIDVQLYSNYSIKLVMCGHS